MTSPAAVAGVAHDRYRFAWRGGNAFRLLVDGGGFFPAMLDAVNGASRYVLLENYLVESGRLMDRFVTALAAAAGRGVEVCVLLDDFGARGLDEADRKRLADAGARLALYNPLRFGRLRRYLLRDHRKLLIVDDLLAYTGGAGLTDAFDPAAAGAQAWRETMIEIRGEVLADWRRLFLENWAHWSDHVPRVLRKAPSPASSDQRGRVTVSGVAETSEIKRSFLKRIRESRRRVWMCTAYFVPSWKLLRALRRAAGRGVDVRLLLPGPHTDHPAVRHAARRHYGKLLRHGVRIFEYQGRVLHAKTLLCDQWVSIGSSNVDRWNLRWNLEANQEVADPGFADAVQSMMEQDFTHCRELSDARWRRRPWWKRLRSRLWGYVDVFLESLRRPAP
jgi:phosphatidylserine/phosphatidylglycerophosphate/cardiolipin synthase-like enzyme